MDPGFPVGRRGRRGCRRLVCPWRSPRTSVWASAGRVRLAGPAALLRIGEGRGGRRGDGTSGWKVVRGGVAVGRSQRATVAPFVVGSASVLVVTVLLALDLPRAGAVGCPWLKKFTESRRLDDVSSGDLICATITQVRRRNDLSKQSRGCCGEESSRNEACFDCEQRVTRAKMSNLTSLREVCHVCDFSSGGGGKHGECEMLRKVVLAGGWRCSRSLRRTVTRHCVHVPCT